MKVYVCWYRDGYESGDGSWNEVEAIHHVFKNEKDAEAWYEDNKPWGGYEDYEVTDHYEKITRKPRKKKNARTR